MKDSNKKVFFFLGLGLGIIIVNLIYQFNPNTKEEEISDDVIIKRAEELGMVSVKDNISLENKQEKEKKNKLKESKKNSGAKDKPSNNKKENKEKIYTVIIESGDTVSDISKKLLDKGLIEDKDSFTREVSKQNAAKVMRTGEYEISTEDSINDIIKKIANKN